MCVHTVVNRPTEAPFTCSLCNMLCVITQGAIFHPNGRMPSSSLPMHTSCLCWCCVVSYVLHRESSFHPNGREGAQEAEEAAARLARNVSKKLQQIAALEARARDAAMGVPGVTQLDGQQLAKLSQKAALTEALHVSMWHTHAHSPQARICNPTHASIH